ncbi:MAG: hypothetical protein ACTHPD_12715 [Rhizomicrobium sp.]
MKIIAAMAAVLFFAGAANAQSTAGDLSMHWSEGAQDCKAHPQPPLQMHRYNATTYILRENLCSTFEAPFLYLLIGQTRALLIDSGDVADAKAMPLAQTVRGFCSTVFRCSWFIPIATWIIARVIRNSRNCRTRKWWVTTSTA